MTDRYYVDIPDHYIGADKQSWIWGNVFYSEDYDTANRILTIIRETNTPAKLYLRDERGRYSLLDDNSFGLITKRTPEQVASMDSAIKEFLSIDDPVLPTRVGHYEFSAMPKRGSR